MPRQSLNVCRAESLNLSTCGSRIDLPSNPPPPGQDAKEKFQVLQRVFSVLGDPEKRKVYDQTGSLEDSVSLEESSKSSFSEPKAKYSGLIRSVVCPKYSYEPLRL